jgi:hypothetical protein
MFHVERGIMRVAHAIVLAHPRGGRIVIIFRPVCRRGRWDLAADVVVLLPTEPGHAVVRNETSTASQSPEARRAAEAVALVLYMSAAAHNAEQDVRFFSASTAVRVRVMRAGLAAHNGRNWVLTDAGWDAVREAGCFVF